MRAAAGSAALMWVVGCMRGLSRLYLQAVAVRSGAGGAVGGARIFGVCGIFGRAFSGSGQLTCCMHAHSVHAGAAACTAAWSADVSTPSVPLMRAALTSCGLPGGSPCSL